MAMAKKVIKKKVSKVKVIRTNFNENLFSKLKEVRNKIAQEQNVAGFIILNDNVLKELAYYYPTNKELFLLIKGAGESKFETYGDQFLKIIGNFIESENLDAKIRNEELKKSILPNKPKINVKERTEMRKAKIKELILKKMSIEDIAFEMELTANTIINYIGRLLVDDSSLDVQYIKDSIEGYNDIVKSFEKHGTEKIGPIYADFGGNVEYNDINLVKVLISSK